MGSSTLVSSSKHWLPSGKVLSLLLTRVRLFPKKVELQALMKYYDMDGDGNITYNEFIRGLR